MFELSPTSPRVRKLRQIYRDTIPTLDAERVKILTDYTKKSHNEVPIIRRAKTLHEILSNMTVRVEPDELTALGTTGVGIDRFQSGTVPSGHYNANYRKAVEKGFGAIVREAMEKLEKMRGNIGGDDSEKYFFYRAIVISCDSAILFSKRYAAECRRQANSIDDADRSSALLRMADSLDWIMENPARTFQEALQVCLLYQYVLLIEEHEEREGKHK